MPVGKMRFNRAIFDRWSPVRTEQFEAFLKRANNFEFTTERADTPYEAYIYTIDHPDFLYTEGEPFYTFKWGRVSTDGGYNYCEVIISLSVERGNYTFELVRRYHTDKQILHVDSIVS